VHFSLQISTFGQGAVPPGWALANSTEMQRLYYIKGGAGRYLCTDGQYESFRQDCFCLFPYNFHACFQSSEADPIDHFIRRFRRAMGQTPYAYLRTYRLALAKQAIASGNTLTQAAEKVGYQNAASLSRALRSAES
jgi:hypothetical protein